MSDPGDPPNDIDTPNPLRVGELGDVSGIKIIENTMLNGEVIRLDGAIRMAPK